MSINLGQKIKMWWLGAFGTAHRVRVSLIRFVIGLAVIALIVIVPIIWQAVVIAAAAQSLERDSTVLIRHIQSGSWQNVSDDVRSIEINVIKIDIALSRLGPVTWIPVIGNTVDQARTLTAPAARLVGVYREISVLASDVVAEQSLDQTVMSIADPRKRQAFLRAIAGQTERWAAVDDELDVIRDDVNGLADSEFTGPWRDQLITAHGLVRQAVNTTELIVPLISHLPDLLGYDQPKTYLLLFQNNTELRPTGGFIGSYGLITVKNGELANLDIDDVYNLDRLTEGKMTELAPEPMRRYNNQQYWYLRDANWSPDWPTAAETIKHFWDTEHSRAGLPPRPIDGIMTITPDVISNILAVTGPISSHGLVFDQANFTNQLEMFVEFDYSKYGIAKEDRKDIILPLAFLLVDKISHLDSDKLLSVWLELKKSVDQKNILLYSFNPDLQSIITRQEWSGQVAQTDHDYILVIDANLASLKTDPAMERSVDYQLTVDQQDNLMSQLTVTYRHTLEPVKDLITRYRTYTRVYLPADTWIERAYIERGGQRQELVIGRDIIISNELGKRVAGTFLVIEPKNEAKLILEYRLPDRIRDQYLAGEYQLLIQKQPGTAGHNLVVDLDLGQTINRSTGPDLPISQDQSKIRWQSDLSVDRNFRVWLP